MKIQEFDFTVDVKQGLLWQYDNAQKIQSLVYQNQAWFDEYQTAFWNHFYNKIFNLTNADSFGCVVWAIILNLPIHLGPPTTRKPTWGFGPKTNKNKNFNNGNFQEESPYSGLTTKEKRILLLIRYFDLCTRAAVPEINAFLDPLFTDFSNGAGTLYAVDNLDMTMDYYFTFQPEQRFLDILENYDILPRPAGVKATINVL